MDNEIPQANTAWRYSRAIERIDKRDMQNQRRRDTERAYISRACTYFISAPPHIAVSDLMQRIKGKTSRKLLMEYKRLNQEFWGRHIWARGYFVASSGNVTDEVILRYIEEQGKEPPEGDFKIDG